MTANAGVPSASMAPTMRSMVADFWIQSLKTMARSDASAIRGKYHVSVSTGGVRWSIMPSRMSPPPTDETVAITSTPIRSSRRRRPRMAPDRAQAKIAR